MRVSIAHADVDLSGGTKTVEFGFVPQEVTITDPDSGAFAVEVPGKGGVEVGAASGNAKVNGVSGYEALFYGIEIDPSVYNDISSTQCRVLAFRPDA